MMKKVGKWIGDHVDICKKVWNLAMAEVAYEDGNYEKALPVFEEIAEQGAACAQDLCGHMYHEGLGTVRDLEKALFWSEKAALQGKVDSQLRCARIYSSDSNTDLVKAEEWLYKAVKNCDELDPLVICAVHFDLFIGWAEKAGQGEEREDAADL